MKSIFDCVIIGAGVAGMTAAIYLKRANRNVLLLEKSAPGGQINRTALVANYPGYEEIDGPSLAMKMFGQTQKLGIPYQYGNVSSIKEEDGIKVITTDVETIYSRSIIVASGRIPRELGLPNEHTLVGRGISWCALCDGLFYKDKVVAVVGGGNSALEESLYLSKLCQEVIVIHRRNEFRAEEEVQERLKKASNIRVIYDSVIKTIIEEDGHVAGLELEKDGANETLAVSALFEYIGYVPDTRFLKGLDLELEEKYLVVDASMRTNIPFIYGCGDVIKKEVYQISTAVGEGAIAAVMADKDLA